MPYFPTSTRSRPVFYLCALAILCLQFCTGVSPDSADSDEAVKSGTILKAKYSRELTDVVFESTPERLARGKYLTEGLYCMTCHTETDKTKPGGPPNLAKKFGGAVRYATDSTHLYAPNLTPDEETGIGLWTDDMLVRAMQEGVGHDGRSLVTPGRGGMPWTDFRFLADEDLASIIVYLRSVPPVKNKIPSRKIGDQLERRFEGRAYPRVRSQNMVDMSNQIERGTYLMNLAHCSGCHKTDLSGGFVIGREGPDKNIVSPNISSDETGIGAWTEESFISALRNGIGRSGQLNYRMPWISFKNLSDEDLAAIFAALKSSYPVKHLVLNNMPDSHCEICNQEHGGGSLNSKIDFSDSLAIPNDLDGIYVSIDFPLDTIQILYEQDTAWVRPGKNAPFKAQLFAINDSTCITQNWRSPYIFTRNREGSVKSLRFHLSAEGAYEKIE